MRMGLGLNLAQFGSSVDPSAGFALYLDFKNSLYRSGATKTADVTTLPGYTYTRSGAKSELLSTGAPTAFAANVPGIVPTIGYWARAALTNLLLNAGTATTLNTQTTAALTAAPYTIYFEGTGSVALSGSFTGSLAGTGANNMVALVFTPTAATLTVTVTGSVTYAGLVLGNFPTGAAIIATAGATASIGADSLATTANPYTADQDFILWAVANFDHAATTTEVLTALGQTSGLWLGRSSTGVLVANLDGAGTYSGPTHNTGRCVILFRRRGGKNTIATKSLTTVAVGVESGVTTFPTTTNKLYIGQYSGTADFVINSIAEGVFAQTGTFSDAQLTSILTAA